MKISFIETQTYANEYNRLCKKYRSFSSDIEKLKNDLLKNPEIGTPLGGNVKKIRFSIQSKNKGKSAGGRMITFETLVKVDEKDIIFVFVYDKSEYSNISDEFIKQVVKDEIKGVK